MQRFQVQISRMDGNFLEERIGLSTRVTFLRHMHHLNKCADVLAMTIAPLHQCIPLSGADQQRQSAHQVTGLQP